MYSSSAGGRSRRLHSHGKYVRRMQNRRSALAAVVCLPFSSACRFVVTLAKARDAVCHLYLDARIVGDKITCAINRTCHCDILRSIELLQLPRSIDASARRFCSGNLDRRFVDCRRIRDGSAHRLVPAIETSPYRNHRSWRTFSSGCAWVNTDLMRLRRKGLRQVRTGSFRLGKTWSHCASTSPVLRARSKSGSLKEFCRRRGSAVVN